MPWCSRMPTLSVSVLRSWHSLLAECTRRCRWLPIMRLLFLRRLGKVTAVVNAQAYRNETVPAAEASVVADENTARAEGAEPLPGGGRGLELSDAGVTISRAPEEYFFRRRLETMEKGLAGHTFHGYRFPLSAGRR